MVPSFGRIADLLAICGSEARRFFRHWRIGGRSGNSRSTAIERGSCHSDTRLLSTYVPAQQSRDSVLRAALIAGETNARR